MSKEKTSNLTEWGSSSSDQNERFFLEGARSRSFELGQILSVAGEMLKGFRKFHFIGPCVTVYGSARFAEDHKYYELAQRVGFSLAKQGFSVMTGGGPGIMEAANRGAKAAGGTSLGCNITLPKEQKHNSYLDMWVEFKFFMVRKLMLAKYSYGFIAMPGGFGTLDELFNILTLIQTGKIKDFPVVLMGVEYWEPLRDLIEKTLVDSGTIDQEDINYITFTDDPDYAARFIRDLAVSKFELKIRAHSFLGESKFPHRRPDSAS